MFKHYVSSRTTLSVFPQRPKVTSTNYVARCLALGAVAIACSGFIGTRALASWDDEDYAPIYHPRVYLCGPADYYPRCRWEPPWRRDNLVCAWVTSECYRYRPRPYWRRDPVYVVPYESRW